MITNGEVLFPPSGKGRPRQKKFLKDLSSTTTGFSTLLVPDVFNTDGTRTLQKIFGERVFIFPKPVEFIAELIGQVTTSQDIVLDSFAGSGTTGHSVLRLNKEDGGDRRFILVEMEENIAQDITAERLKRVINGYTWKDAKDKKQIEAGLGGGFRYCSLGETIFNPDGTINPAIKFKDLARHIYFTETRNPWPGKAKGPFIGEFDGVSYYLFFNGVEGGNGFGRAELALLPKDHAPKVVYADKTRLGPAALAAGGLTFKHIPYEIKVE
jgi:site-specific DNA-methyltransferase (adenine-specific)/adenine-specific DNA-methyltransferase